MATGPSKEDLETYWQSSRQYFDELARHYQTADPEYYKEFIKPFYDNPFRSVSSGQPGKSGGGGKVMVIAVFLLVFIGAISAGLFFFIGDSQSVKEKVEELTSDKNTTEQKTTKEKKITREENGFTEEPPVSEEPVTGKTEELSGEDNYIIGAKYIAEKKYDKAAWHLKQIKKGDKRYKEAQQLLESIKYLKKYDK